MESWMALDMCIGRDAEAIAERIGRKPVTLRKWKENPAESGERNPLDVIQDTINAALALGRSREEALAPLRYLEEYFAANAPAPNIHDAHADLMHEMSLLMLEHSAAVRDGVVSPSERRRLARKIEHLRGRLDEYSATVDSGEGC